MTFPNARSATPAPIRAAVCHLAKGILGEYVTEASALGWPPGTWPGTVSSDLCDRQLTAIRFQYDAEGDLEFVRYRSGPVVVTVFND